MTSLNMPGFSITLLLLPGVTDAAISANEILSLLDAKCAAPGWKWSSTTPPSSNGNKAESHESGARPADTAGRKLVAQDAETLVQAVKRACDALIEAEKEITRLDVACGDGDCGITLRNGAQGVLKEVESGRITGQDVVGSVIRISKVAEAVMDGTSGALYSIFFSALAQKLQTGPEVVTKQEWASAVNFGLETLYRYTAARPPSRTLLDPLAEFAFALGKGDSVRDAVDKASMAAEGTKNLEAKAGRAAYVEREQIKGIPDPGAIGVKVVLEAIAASL